MSRLAGGPGFRVELLQSLHAGGERVVAEAALARAVADDQDRVVQVGDVRQDPGLPCVGDPHALPGEPCPPVADHVLPGGAGRCLVCLCFSLPSPSGSAYP